MPKTRNMRLWEYDHGTSMEELFGELEELTLNELAEKYDLPYATLYGWYRKMGVQIKKSVEFAGAAK